MRERYKVEDGKIVHHRQHDVSGIIKANKFLQSEQTMRHQSETVNHVAHIDMLAAVNWMKERGITHNAWKLFMSDPKFIKDFLNDPDNKAWRTRLGKI